MINKRAQLAIFIIVAVVIVAGILTYFFVRGSIGTQEYPPELAPVFEKYRSCIEQATTEAIQIAETQGGRIELGSYIPGSDYAPFSSQLNFMGNPAASIKVLQTRGFFVKIY